MRFLIQRVSRASVRVDGNITGEIGKGILVLVGIAKHDSRTMADQLVEKLIHLRIFTDTEGKMNLSLKDVNGGLLLVSQFTLYGDTKRGRRPSFDLAAPPAVAKELWDYVVERVASTGLVTQTGVFQAHMEVELVNDGPVTLLLEVGGNDAAASAQRTVSAG